MAVLLLVSSLLTIACADPDDGDTVDVNRPWLDELPDNLDFGGEEIVFVYAEGGGYNFTQRSIEPDEESADNVDRMVFDRNSAIEERLNIDITSIQASTVITGLQDAINSSLSSSSGDYDIIAGYQYYDIDLASKGYLIDLTQLGEGDYADADYIDLDKEYWAKDYIESIAYKDSIYWVTGDLSLRYVGGMYCTFVNADIYNEKLKDDHGDIYQLALDGKWTLDKLNEFAKICYEDDGDQETNETDVLGYAWECNDPIDGIAFGAGIEFSTSYPDGSVAMTLRNPRSITFVEKLDTLLHSEYTYRMPTAADSANVMALYASGNVAFHVNKLFQAETYLRDMESDYYIIPAPKLNDTQKEYVTGIHDGITLYGIPYDAENVAASAATLEALAAESLRTVTPEYYESSLKFKYTRDDTAAQVIDLMRSTTTSNFAAAWSKSLGDIAKYFRNNNTASTASSTMSKTNSAAQTKLTDLLTTLDSVSEPVA